MFETLRTWAEVDLDAVVHNNNLLPGRFCMNACFKGLVFYTSERGNDTCMSRGDCGNTICCHASDTNEKGNCENDQPYFFLIGVCAAFTLARNVHEGNYGNENGESADKK